MKLTDEVVDLVGNKGIKLLKPFKFNLETLAGTEWNLDKFKKIDPLVQQNNIMYTNQQGELSVRLTNYNRRNIEELSIEHSEISLINISEAIKSTALEEIEPDKVLCRFVPRDIILVG